MAFKIKHECDVDIRGTTATTTLGKDGTIVIIDGAKTATVNTDGFNGKVFHSDQSGLAATCYPTIMGGPTGPTGYYTPAFDTNLSYNPYFNVLTVAGLQLSATVNTSTLSTASLVIDGNFQTFREFQFVMTALQPDIITGFIMNNRRINGIYKTYISNTSGVSKTINGTLTGQTNRTSFSTTPIANGETWILTNLVANFAGVSMNCLSLERFV
jgi:hypothetical protein